MQHALQSKGTNHLMPQPNPPPRVGTRATFVIDMAVNIILPVLVYIWLKPHLGDIDALLASSLPPIAWSLIEFLRRRKIDALSMLVLAGIALSLLAFAGGGGIHLLQLRENLVTGLIGLAFLGSAAIGHPLIYQLARATEARKSAANQAAFEARRDKPLFKRTIMTMTLVWGTGLVTSATLSIALVYTLPIQTYLIISPILGYGTMGALTLWTLWLSRHRSTQPNQ